MTLAGWEFSVLSPAYAIHWGFQTKKNRKGHYRAKQIEANSRRLPAFKRETKAKYGLRAQLEGKETYSAFKRRTVALNQQRKKIQRKMK